MTERDSDRERESKRESKRGRERDYVCYITEDMYACIIIYIEKSLGWTAGYICIVSSYGDMCHFKAPTDTTN